MKTLLLLLSFLALAWSSHHVHDEANEEKLYREERLHDQEDSDDDDGDDGDDVDQEDGDDEEDTSAKKPCLLTNKHRYDACARKCRVYKGRLVECARIRKDFESMSQAERVRFIRAYHVISTNQKYRPAYVKLIKMHEKYFFTNIHKKEQFFPWHRWFNLQIENMLRQVDCRVTLPFWDWSIWSQDPWDRKFMWSPVVGLGGNGRKGDECVVTGPFKLGKWKTASGKCLRRAFNGKPPDADEIMIAIKEPAFDKFEAMVRVNIHEGMHCFINGTMCSLQAAEAPEFFLHHGFVDKIWSDFQKKGSYHKNAFFPSIKKKMVAINFYPKDLIDNNNLPGGVAVEYEDPSIHGAKKIRDFLKVLSLKQLEHIQRLAFSKTPENSKRLFHLSTSERNFAARLEKETMSSVDGKRRGSIFAKTLSSLERVVGFEVPKYCKTK